MHFFLISLLIVSLCSCSAVNKSHKKVNSANVPVISFDCTERDKVQLDTIIEITARDISNCYFPDNKTLWIVFWVPYCGENSKEAKLASKYQDSINLVPISLIWDYENVFLDISNTGHQVFFLDHTLPKHRVRSRREFLKQLLGNNFSEEHVNASELFIKNGSVIHQCYREGISDSLVHELIN